jgi:hypothetical protein
MKYTKKEVQGMFKRFCNALDKIESKKANIDYLKGYAEFEKSEYEHYDNWRKEYEEGFEIYKVTQTQEGKFDCKKQDTFFKDSEWLEKICEEEYVKIRNIPEDKLEW